MLRYPVPNVNGDVGLHGEILRKPAHIRPNPFRILTCNVQGVAPLQHHSGPRAIQSHTNAPIAAANIFAQVGKAHMQPATGLYGNLHRPFASCRAHPSRTPAISCGLESVVIPSMEASFRELSMSTERILSSSFSPPGRVVIVVPSAWSTFTPALESTAVISTSWASLTADIAPNVSGNMSPDPVIPQTSLRGMS